MNTYPTYQYEVISWEVLIEYTKGALSTEEKQKVEKYLEENPEEKEALEGMILMAEAKPSINEIQNFLIPSDEEIHLVLNEIKVAHSSSGKILNLAKKVLLSPYFVGVAAVIVVFFMVFLPSYSPELKPIPPVEEITHIENKVEEPLIIHLDSICEEDLESSNHGDFKEVAFNDELGRLLKSSRKNEEAGDLIIHEADDHNILTWSYFAGDYPVKEISSNSGYYVENDFNILCCFGHCYVHKTQSLFYLPIQLSDSSGIYTEMHVLPFLLSYKLDQKRSKGDSPPRLIVVLFNRNFLRENFYKKLMRKLWKWGW